MAAGSDAVLLVSFGGPEGPDDVMPFLDNVLRGRNVPEARKLEVAEHYYHFGGVSPINGENRALAARLIAELEREGMPLPVYWGNRNWAPYLVDTLRDMHKAGIKRAFAFLTSALSSYSGCRQYLEDIQRAQEELGGAAPQVSVTRRFYNHPLYVSATAAHLAVALETLKAPRAAAHVVFTAHSIPLFMSEQCDYQQQFEEVARLVAEAVQVPKWSVAYQSRSGPAVQPWLGPDVLEELSRLQGLRETHVAICPVGFVSDHMEVVWDLDVEAKQLASELGLRLARAKTASTHPDFVTMICELIREAKDGIEPRAIGRFGPRVTPCQPGCCPAPQRPRR